MIGLCLMTVPMLLDTAVEPTQLLHQWARVYYYGVRTMPPMAITTFVLYGYTILKKRAERRPWLVYAVASLVTVGMIPFTWYVLAPTNNTLFRLEAQAASGNVVSLETVLELVIRWNKLHMLRSMFPLAGVFIGLSGHL
jgi:hypothetical protein